MFYDDQMLRLIYSLKRKDLLPIKKIKNEFVLTLYILKYTSVS